MADRESAEEHKDRLPSGVQGGAAAKSTPANSDSSDVGGTATKATGASEYDPNAEPSFAYRKPGSNEGLSAKIENVVSG
ncbi:hypothetical protein MMC10_007999 [Thelotrema lepadinum]|nr:hypothetical protein [Thelotrema lepadinum]